MNSHSCDIVNENRLFSGPYEIKSECAISHRCGAHWVSLMPTAIYLFFSLYIYLSKDKHTRKRRETHTYIVTIL